MIDLEAIASRAKRELYDETRDYTKCEACNGMGWCLHDDGDCIDCNGNGGHYTIASDVLSLIEEVRRLRAEKAP